MIAGFLPSTVSPLFKVNFESMIFRTSKGGTCYMLVPLEGYSYTTTPSTNGEANGETSNNIRSNTLCVLHQVAIATPFPKAIHLNLTTAWRLYKTMVAKNAMRCKLLIKLFQKKRPWVNSELPQVMYSFCDLLGKFWGVPSYCWNTSIDT